MLKKSTIQLLRFHFSFFLMPVFWFALSQINYINFTRAVIIFILLHLLVYPSSNGYNSYMDRDKESIGGIKNPEQPTLQLYYTTILMDIVALLCSLFISLFFFTGILAFIVASRAYSFRGIRLKKYPIVGYLTVILFQGALVYLLVFQGSSSDHLSEIPFYGMLASAFLIGGFYPLTQIYQHRQDAEDGVTSISALLGYRGTFLFTAVIYVLAMGMLAIQLNNNGLMTHFFYLQLFFMPVLIIFFWWFYKVYNDVSHANYINSMRMNKVASLCSNAAFIFLLITKQP